jgi:hypothetical protein
VEQTARYRSVGGVVETDWLHESRLSHKSGASPNRLQPVQADQAGQGIAGLITNSIKNGWLARDRFYKNQWHSNCLPNDRPSRKSKLQFHTEAVGEAGNGTERAVAWVKSPQGRLFWVGSFNRWSPDKLNGSGWLYEPGRVVKNLLLPLHSVRGLRYFFRSTNAVTVGRTVPRPWRSRFFRGTFFAG